MFISRRMDNLLHVNKAKYYATVKYERIKWMYLDQ